MVYIFVVFFIFILGTCYQDIIIINILSFQYTKFRFSILSFICLLTFFIYLLLLGPTHPPYVQTKEPLKKFEGKNSGETQTLILFL